jgi:predicted Zn-dependent peptidase
MATQPKSKTKQSVAVPKDGDIVYKKTVLPNGLRIVTETIPSVRSISLGVWIDVGSRNEKPEESGISHYIEHMVFKGTKKRSARQIAESLESIGGILNAFTSREQTCYTARILDEHLPIAMDVLSDITCNATFTKTNLEREKLVILEEIKESLDTPSDHIHDIFAEAYWGDHPLGRPIMGTMETIQAMPRERVMSYVKRNYRAGSVVVAACGSVSHTKLVDLCRKLFTFPEGKADSAQTASAPANRTVHETDTHEQTHLCIGFPGIAFTSSERTIATALSTYLGGGMSSVLFQKIREDKGLAYTVYCYSDFYRDAGLFGIYLATDSGKKEQAIDIALSEVRKLKRKPLGSLALDQIKAQLKGQMTLAMESTSSRMSRLARHELILGDYRPLSVTLKEIDALKPSMLQALAERLFHDKLMTLATLGPADTSASGHAA